MDIVHAFQDGSWWCWWLFLDLRTKWKKAEKTSRLKCPYLFRFAWLYQNSCQCPIVHAFQDGSWWCWWLFLDMRTKWKKASARPRLGSNRALRQRPTNSLLQTSKPGRSLFVLGVFFFVLSFRLLLLLDLLGVFGFACLYRDL